MFCYLLLKACPYCKSTSKRKGDNGHFFITNNSYSSFSNCCKGGDAINFFEEVEGLEFKDAKAKLYNLTNTPLIADNKTFTPSKSKEEIEAEKQKLKQQQQEQQKQEDINDKFIKDNFTKMNEEQKQQAKDYLKQRGITEEAINKYKMFIHTAEGTTRLIIPIIEEGKAKNYIGRNIDVTAEKNERYKNGLGAIPLFNSKYLKEEAKDKEKLFICEGVFDALTIEQQGFKAISLNSTSGKNKLIETIKQNKENASKYLFVLSLDNDNSGQGTTEELQASLTNLGIRHAVLEIPTETEEGKPIKDINEWYLTADTTTFEEDIKRNIFEKYDKKTIGYYLNDMEQGFISELTKAQCKHDKQTLFKNLDEQLNGGIRDGLYVLGAISSLGKTTLALQIADNLARQGEKVIIFSIEMGRFELVNKTLSRLTYINNPYRAKTNLDIMKSETITAETEEAIKDYLKFANNIIIEQGNFGFNVDNINEYLKDYIEKTGQRPFVLVDYLQILQPPKNLERATDKAIVDYNVKTLKQIARNYNIPIFVISSFNRQNYYADADLEAFKESGGIEYTADVVFALQLRVMQTLTEEQNKGKVKEAIKTATADPRNVEMQVKCLKKKKKKKDFFINFKYNKLFNYFEELPQSEQDGI